MPRALLLAVLATACGEAAPAPDGAMPDPYPAECENISPAHCLLPWPSDRFLVDGAIRLPETGMPSTRRGVGIDPSAWARRDGFALAPSPMTMLSPAPDPSTLHGQDRIGESLGADATAVIVDVATGERVPCFAELDRWDDVDPARVPLYVQPAESLAPSTRYAVGLRRLTDAGGAPIPPSAFFAALRDGTPLPGSDVEARRGELEDVFAALEASGFARGELIEAWGFTTASIGSLTEDLLAMRDAMLAQPPGACTGTMVEDADAGAVVPAGIWRRIQGTFRAPLFLTGTTASSVEESRLARGPDGLPATSTWVEVPFHAWIPTSVRDRVVAGGASARVIVYGHGILGSRLEAEGEFMLSHAAEMEAVVVATDWWGMAEDDLTRVVSALNMDFSYLDATTDRLHQGVLNAATLMRSVRETCASIDAFAVARPDGSRVPAYDPAALHFYGNSQGAILGATLAGIEPATERFVLGVGGAGWSMIIRRSDAWRGFGAVLSSAYTDPLERALMVAMMSPLFAPLDGATYAPHLVADPLPGSRAKRILAQIGIGDVAVTNLAGHFLARSAGIPLLVPSPEEPFGLELSPGPAPSALTIFALPGVLPIAPGPGDPGPDTPSHDGVRRIPAARAQIDAFLQPGGDAIHPCDGPCDPE